MSRKYSAAEKAKRDRKFLVKIARRENPVRGTMCLPPDVNLNDVMWRPDRVEILLNWLEEDRKQALADEMKWMRRKAAEYLADVQRDRERGLL